MKGIAALFRDESVKADDPHQRGVLATLRMIYEGGSLDGKTGNFSTPDVWCVVAGLHRGNWHFFETYKRTIWVNLGTGRTIFRCAGLTVRSNNSSRWKRLLPLLRIRKLRSITIP